MTTSNHRTEPFRYVISPPKECCFEIIKMNDKDIVSKRGKALLLDLNKSGCKFSTALDLYSFVNAIELNISFNINEETVSFPGMIRWQKKSGVSNIYGVRFDLSPEEKKQTLTTIRALAGSGMIKVM